MATIVKPQVLVHQEFTLVPAEITEPLRAHVCGPNALLHRYSDADEKETINVGEYVKDAETAYPWPGRSAGGLVDLGYTRVYMENALLMYFEDLIGSTAGGRGVVAPVSGRTNWVRSSTVNFKTNGDYARSDLLGDRDVRVGDRVYLRGVEDPDGACLEHELWTYVTGLAADEVEGSVGDGRADAANQATVEAETTIEQTAGAENCITATADGSAYDGLASGYVTETYTIEVVKSSIAGCQAARLRVTSASGTDDQDEVTPEAFGDATAIGTRGLEVTFDNTGNVSCSASAEADDVAPTDFIAGQTWVVEVTQAFEKTCIESGGDYTGDVDDVYVIEVETGGAWADLPTIKVTTAKGLDASGPTEVSGPNEDIAIGTHGVTARFVDCFGDSSSSEVALGDDDLAEGLRTGDRFYITVTTASDGPVRTLILKHSVPSEIRDAEDLDLRLFIEKDIEVSEDRLSDPPLVNWEQESTQLLLQADITAYDSSWTFDGVETAMPVHGGTVFIHYREWVPTLANAVGSINDTADLDDIPGPTSPDNPLKYGVLKALQNSGGTAVKYTAVADPDDVDSWQEVIERVDGRDDLYNFAPLTRDAAVLALFQAHTDSESSAESGNWKGLIVNLLATSERMQVGQSSAAAQALRPTSEDGELVLATLADNPNATGTQYTLLEDESGNAAFLTHGVQAGDLVRFLFTTDAFGNESYTEFVVDEVLSESALLLLEGHSVPVSEAQKVEIWHTLTKDEIVADLVGQAQAYSNRRVVAVWPDVVGSGGETVPGYFLAAGLAGLISSVVPHQGLTNVQVAGFDDYSRSTTFLSASQLSDLQDGGVWIVTEDRDGTPHTYHALTTDLTDLNRREEMIRRNVDAISYLFLRRLKPFIGRTNVTPSMLRRLEFEINSIFTFLKRTGFTEELGSQLIDGTIVTLEQHPLLADRVTIVLNLTVPAPLNNIELHLVV